MKPICAKCQLEFKVVQQGIAAVPMFMNPPKPYQIYAADLLECPLCHFQIAGQFANLPLAEHYQDEFALRFSRFSKVVRAFERVEQAEEALREAGK